jgi:hypothetical protein
MSRTNQRLDFAPVSNVPSSLLRFAAAYFVFSGVVYGLLVAAALVAGLLGKIPFTPTVSHVFGVVIALVSAVGLVWTGSLLGRGSRPGGYLALGFSLMPIVVAALMREPQSTINVVVAVIGVIVLAVVWRDLK